MEFSYGEKVHRSDVTYALFNLTPLMKDMGPDFETEKKRWVIQLDSYLIGALPEKGTGTLESQVGEDSPGVTSGWIGNSKIFQIGQSDIGTSFEAISDSWTNEWLRRNGLPHHKIFLNFSSRRNNFSTGGCTISYKQRHQWYDYFSNPMTSVTQMFSKRPSEWQISYFRDRFCTILSLNRSLDVVVIRFEGILRRR